MRKAELLFHQYLPLIERELELILPREDGRMDAVLCKAMRYAVLNGGKRIRPVLTMEFCRVCGGEPEQALSFACAVELIHSYSLVHDDLPCMDNDAIRRGKPSCHKAFGEDMALLAGDALLTKAFEALLPEVEEPRQAMAAVKAAKVLSQYAGSEGMVGGQAIDLLSEGKQVGIDVLQRMDEGKTVALISAACQMGCILANADEEKLTAAKKYASHIVMDFQIMDDILDVTGNTEELGKQVGSDQKNKKSTYVSILGLEKATEYVNQLTKEAVDALSCFDDNSAYLADLAWMLAERKK